MGTRELSKAILAKLSNSSTAPCRTAAIVGILDEAFAGIATAKANAEKNLHNARTLFHKSSDSPF